MAFSAVRSEILYAWRGPSLLITNTRGECDVDQQVCGFYFREARHLRTLVLQINGRRPWLCEAASIDPSTLALTFVISLANLWPWTSRWRLQGCRCVSGARSRERQNGRSCTVRDRCTSFGSPLPNRCSRPSLIGLPICSRLFSRRPFPRNPRCRMTADLLPLHEQVMVITGASSGIGLVTARQAAARGARVVLVARNGRQLLGAGVRVDHRGSIPLPSWWGADQRGQRAQRPRHSAAGNLLRCEARLESVYRRPPDGTRRRGRADLCDARQAGEH